MNVDFLDAHKRYLFDAELMAEDRLPPDHFWLPSGQRQKTLQKDIQVMSMRCITKASSVAFKRLPKFESRR